MPSNQATKHPERNKRATTIKVKCLSPKISALTTLCNIMGGLQLLKVAWTCTPKARYITIEQFIETGGMIPAGG